METKIKSKMVRVDPTEEVCYITPYPGKCPLGEGVVCCVYMDAGEKDSIHDCPYIGDITKIGNNSEHQENEYPYWITSHCTHE